MAVQKNERAFFFISKPSTVLERTPTRCHFCIPPHPGLYRSQCQENKVGGKVNTVWVKSKIDCRTKVEIRWGLFCRLLSGHIEQRITVHPALDLIFVTLLRNDEMTDHRVNPRTKISAGSLAPMYRAHYENEQDEVQVQSHCAQTELGALRRRHPSPLSPRS